MIMDAPFHPFLTKPDIIVLQNLKRNIDDESNEDVAPHKSDSHSTAQLLSNLNNPKSQDFSPTIFTSWDSSDISPWIQHYLVYPYVEWAKTVVRRPTDVVFLTHILL